MNENKPKSPPPLPMGRVLAQGSTIGVQAGCISVGLVLLALVAGLALDQVLNTKPMFVLGLLLLSIPVSLIAMVKSVLDSSKSLRQSGSSTSKKEDGSGEQDH
jgi:F0F1-type ATP synthase assembly protein I